MRSGFIERLAQAIQFFLEHFGSSRRIGWWYERASREFLVSKCAVKPNSKLTRNFQRAERNGVIPRVAVRRAIAGDAELVKEIANLARNDAFELETAEEIGFAAPRATPGGPISRPSVERAPPRTDEA